MKLNGLIYTLPRELKNLVIPFILVLSIGYFVSILLVDHTSSLSPTGIEENYLGNESQVKVPYEKLLKGYPLNLPFLFIR